MNTQVDTLQSEREIDISAFPDTSNRKNKSIPTEKLIDLREKGLSYAQIAKVVGCSKANVLQRLKGWDTRKKHIEHFRKYRADILADLQRRIVESLSDKDIKRMAPDRRVWSLGVLYDKERLERGQSTNNVSVLVQRYRELAGEDRDKYKQLSEQIASELVEED